MSDGPRPSRGFTLLELLVATAMTAVLAGSLYATLRTAFVARRKAGEAVGEMRRAELAVERVRADIQSAVVPRGLLAGEFLGEDATGGSGRPADGLVLHCTAGGGAETEGTGDIRRVELTCEADEDGDGLVLVRRVRRYLLATRIEEPPAEVLCRGVRSFDLKYHDGTDWQDSWDSTTRGDALPLAVQVTIELVGAGAAADEDGYIVCRIFRIACATRPEEAQAGAAP